MVKVGSRALLMASVALLAAAGAHAADAPPAANTAQADARPADIIVTAQKREQRLIDVPQSVSVVSAQTLQQVHAERFDDYFARIPSAAINEGQAGQARLILRGINAGGTGATVATYVDETPYGSATSLANGAVLTPDLDPNDIERVEVLRGPQGTLYGANSLGGLIKFVTVAPSMDGVHVFGQAGIEDVDGGNTGWSGHVGMNLPMGDTLALRGSGFYRKDPGFIDDADGRKDVNGGRTYGGRIAALFKPTESLTLRATAVLQNIDSDGTNSEDVDPVTLKPVYGDYVQQHVVRQINDTKYRLYNGTGTYDFGPVKLVSATSWGNLDETWRQDATAVYGALLGGLGADLDEHVRQRRFTQEVRLASSNPGFLDWTVGGYYTHERNLIAQILNGTDPTDGGIFPGLGGLATVDLGSTYREIAGFANATVHFGPMFDVTLGGRYSHNKQLVEQVNGGALQAPSDTTNRSTDNVFTFSVAPSFKPNDHTTIYARVARGYQPGGPNVLPAVATLPADFPKAFGPDTTTNYEIGIKSELLDRKLLLELTGFWIDWRKIQILTAFDNFGVVTNGGRARSKGIEFSGVLTPVKGLTLSANGAYTDAKLRDDGSPLTGAKAGDDLPYAPKFSSTVAIDYDRPLSGSLDAIFGVSWRYSGRRRSGFDPDFGQHRLGAYSQLDAHAGVTFDGIRIDAFVRNLTNSKGILDVGTAGSANNGALSAAIVRPRSIGLTLGAKY